MSVFNDLLVESDAVKREMRRLRDLHGVLYLALQQAVRERHGKLTEKRLAREVERLIHDATIVCASA